MTALAAASSGAAALDPEQVFQKASASIVTVQSLNEAGDIVSFGSGVVISPGEVLTTCRALDDGVTFRVKKARNTSQAYLRFYDKVRDLCQLHAPLAPSFTRQVRGLVALDDLRRGQRVYAIGTRLSLELSLTEGTISAIRYLENESPELIQTTAVVLPGSIGGGLFDQDGRLVGITTVLPKGSRNPNLTFALPASWVLEQPSRQTDEIERLRRQEAEKRAVAAAAELGRKEQELRRREERVRAFEEAAAEAIWLEEKRRLDAEADEIAAATPEAQPMPPFEARLQSLPEPYWELKYETLPMPSAPPGSSPSGPVAHTGVLAPPKLQRQDEGAALRRFQQSVVRTIGKVMSERDDPRLARHRGWQGSAMVRVEIGADGLRRAVNVIQSSGDEFLDDSAISQIREIKLPDIPDELRERAFSVDVPVSFSLNRHTE